MKQVGFSGVDSYKEISKVLAANKAHKILLVCGRKSFDALSVKNYLEKLPYEFIRYSEFHPNPDYESVVRGIKVFKEQACDFIMAIGGGSAIDVAKCIKYFAPMDTTKNYLQQDYVDNNIKFLAMPTTAGTGSEATHFAVIYFEGKKYSVAHPSLLPDYVILDSNTLDGLPLYQKKSAMLDALCQAIESWWSKKANAESIGYSKEAITIIIKNMEKYLAGDKVAAAEVLKAAHLAGEAINITTTTAAHAMSYKLTSMYGIAHGHAVALCLPKVWRYMEQVEDNQIQCTFSSISKEMGFDNVIKAIEWFEKLLLQLDMKTPKIKGNGDLNMLVKAVNTQRLSNSPITFNKNDIREIYAEILNVV